MIRVRHRHSRTTGGVRAGRPATGRRDPAHVLYDQACDLLAAAQGLRAAAPEDAAAPAIAATLGCLEAALDALAAATDDMGRLAVDRLAAARDMLPERTEDVDPGQAERRFERLGRSLRDGRDVAAELRERVGPAVAELTQV